jgi:hypothetical protein
MTALANLLGMFLILRAPEGGAAWAYLLLASAAVGGAIVYRSRMRGRSNS